jgi:hypothetical protein
MPDKHEVLSRRRWVDGSDDDLRVSLERDDETGELCAVFIAPTAPWLDRSKVEELSTYLGEIRAQMAREQEPTP